MTRAQYILLCATAALSLVAYLQGRALGKALQRGNLPAAPQVFNT